MEDSKKGIVAQSDLLLFKQEMKSDLSAFKQEIKSDLSAFKQEMKYEYNLFISNINNSIKETIRGQLTTIGRWVIGMFTVFILGFWTYFELSTNKVDQVSSERIARMDERIIYMERIENAIMSSLRDSGFLKNQKADIKKHSPASALNAEKTTGKSRKRKVK